MAKPRKKMLKRWGRLPCVNGSNLLMKPVEVGSKNQSWIRWKKNWSDEHSHELQEFSFVAIFVRFKKWANGAMGWGVAHTKSLSTVASFATAVLSWVFRGRCIKRKDTIGGSILIPSFVVLLSTFEIGDYQIGFPSPHSERHPPKSRGS